VTEQARQRYKTIGLISGWSIAALFALAAHLRYVEGITGAIFSDSEPLGWYRTVSGSVQRDEMVQLRQLLKHVAGVPGDIVAVTPAGSIINGKLWPHSAVPAQSDYKPYAYGTYKLAPGQYWLLGSNPWSYDSRLIGPIPQDLISGPVKPLWTHSNGYAPGTRPW
jgi:type IV secretory pathway protease TraF